MDDPGLALLRNLVDENPDAVLGETFDRHSVILALGPLRAPKEGVKIGQALRWTDAVRVTNGVWVVPKGVLFAPQGPAPGASPLEVALSKLGGGG